MPDTTVHGQNPAYHDPDCITINKFKALEEQLPHAEVLFPGSEAYEKAIFIGNLLYRFITPACVVMARTHKDIQITVKFARENGFDLTVRNGGHSYAGYCLNKGGIVVDLKHMHKVHVDEEEMTVTLEGGTIWKQAYSHLKGKLLPHIIIGGQCPTVGVSGFTLGGGLSPFSRNYGLAVDQLLEMKLVTAEGELVHLTAHETDQRKRDLFWAVRGGGGGNFGITVWMKCRIHKLRNPFGIVVCGQLSWKLPDQQEDFNEMMKVFNTTEWPKELTVDGLWTYDTTNQLLGEMTVIYNGTMDECNQVIKPLLNFKPANNLQEMHWTDWERLEEGFDPMSKVYHHHASFIFGDKGITPEVTDLIQKLMLQFQELVGKQDPKAPTQSTAHILWDHTGAATSQVAPTDTAYFWRDGVYVTTIKAQWVDPSMNEKMLDFVAFAKGKLAPYALKGYAAYLNYIDSTVKDWQQAYYGNNYCELQRIKSEWDPHNFFHFPQSIEPVGHHHPIIDTKKKWDKFCLPKPKALLPMKNDEDVYQKGREIRRGLLAGGKGTF